MAIVLQLFFLLNTNFIKCIIVTISSLVKNFLIQKNIKEKNQLDKLKKNLLIQIKTGNKIK